MMVEGGYHLAPNSRFFGFATTFNSAEVGYEAWSMMNYPNHEIVSDDKDIVIKHFDGGLYATIDVPEGFSGDIKDYWQILHRWIVESEEYTAERPEPGVMPELGEEEDFHVKTIDMGKFNTMNLQKALADSMRELLGEEEKKSDTGRIVKSHKDSMGNTKDFSHACR